MKHHPSCGTTYMEDCECEAMTNNPTPAVEAALDNYFEARTQQVDAQKCGSLSWNKEADKAVRVCEAALLALLRQPEAATDAEEVAAEDVLRERMADLLSRTAIALRGPEPPLSRWSWHDLPERAAAAIAAIDVMQKAAAMLAAAPSPTPISMGAPGGSTRDASAHSANGDNGRDPRPAPVPPAIPEPTSTTGDEAVAWLDAEDFENITKHGNQSLGLFTIERDNKRTIPVYTRPAPAAVEMPIELFDSYSVLKELTVYEQRRTSAENATDVLNATVRLIRRRLEGKKG